MASALVILADGFEEIEAFSIIDILRRALVEVCIAGVKWGDVKSARGVVVKPDAIIETVDYESYDMIILPGGAGGASNINSSKTVEDILLNFKENKKYIAAICASPYILANKGILDGCMATSYPTFRDKVEPHSQYLDANVVIDENIITSRGPATSAEFAFTLVEILKGERVADKIRGAMLFDD